MKVAIIDDGVYVDHSMNIIRTERISFLKAEDGEVVLEKRNPNLTVLSHGTICFWIFSEYLQRSDYELVSIKVLDFKRGEGLIQDLETALRWCIGEGFDIICMSIGNTGYQSFYLEPVVKELAQAGTIIVAACNNKNVFTFPASSRYVLGVRRGTGYFLRDQEYFYNENDIVNVELTVSLNLNEIGKKIDYDLSIHESVNSFMVPYIAAEIGKLLLEKKVEPPNIKRVLREKSVDAYPDMAYIRRQYSEWSDEIQVPVIALYSEDAGINDEFVVRLCRTFHRDGYKAVCILKTESEEFYIYNQKKLDLITDDFKEQLLLLDNSSLADIIIVPVDREFLMTNKKNFDAVVSNDLQTKLLFETIAYDTDIMVQYQNIIEKIG